MSPYLLTLYYFYLYCSRVHHVLHSFPTRRSSDLVPGIASRLRPAFSRPTLFALPWGNVQLIAFITGKTRSEEHTSELQSHSDIVCRLLLEKKKNIGMLLT